MTDNSEQLIDLSTLCTHEREAFSGSLEVHMQPLQKIMSNSKVSKKGNTMYLENLSSFFLVSR